MVSRVNMKWIYILILISASIFLVDYFNLLGGEDTDISIAGWIVNVAVGWYIIMPITLFILLFGGGFSFASHLQDTPYTKDEKGKVKQGQSGFFSKLSPGIVKISHRGGTPVAIHMHHEGWKYQGNEKKVDGVNEIDKVEKIAVDEEHFFNIVKDENWSLSTVIPRPKFNLVYDLPFITYRYMWWWWKMAVFKTTGMLFTGIPHWQTLRDYPLQYMKIEAGTPTLKSNYSTEIRVRNFDTYFEVPSVETSNNVELIITVHLILKSVNPWLTAYGVSQNESWYNRILGVVTSQVRDYYRVLRYDETLKDKTGLITTIKEKAKDPLNLIGIKISNAYVYNQAIVSEKLKAALAKVAEAMADAQSRGIEAEAEAAALKVIVEEVQKDKTGSIARYVYEKEAGIRLVGDLPSGSIVNIGMSGGSQSENEVQSPLLALILKELKSGKKSTKDVEEKD